MEHILSLVQLVCSEIDEMGSSIYPPQNISQIKDSGYEICLRVEELTQKVIALGNQLLQSDTLTEEKSKELQLNNNVLTLFLPKMKDLYEQLNAF